MLQVTAGVQWLQYAHAHWDIVNENYIFIKLTILHLLCLGNIYLIVRTCSFKIN